MGNRVKTPSDWLFWRLACLQNPHLRISIAMDNIPIGLCIGVTLGAAYEGHYKNKNKDKYMRPMAVRYAFGRELTKQIKRMISEEHIKETIRRQDSLGRCL